MKGINTYFLITIDGVNTCNSPNKKAKAKYWGTKLEKI